jgi:hypothetical protein
VSVLQVLLQSRRLRIASALPEAKVLQQEMETIKAKLTLPSPDATDWREREHDDLVLAVAIAAWAAEEGIGLREMLAMQGPPTRYPTVILAD